MFNTDSIQQNGVQKVKRLQAEAGSQRLLKQQPLQASQTMKPEILNLYNLLINIFGKRAFS